MTSDCVLVTAGRPAAANILKPVALEVKDNIVVLPREAWVKICLERATMVMSDSEHRRWSLLRYRGTAEYGIWLSGADPVDIAATGGNPTWDRARVHVTEAAYSQLRSKYLPWWVKVKYKAGWNYEAPNTRGWVDANDPTPYEMLAYKELVGRYLNAGDLQYDLCDALYADIERRAARCDRDMKFFKLSKAKASK